jgi:hypothetical protein
MRAAAGFSRGALRQWRVASRGTVNFLLVAMVVAIWFMMEHHHLFVPSP